jgi:hypothetical protein
MDQLTPTDHSSLYSFSSLYRIYFYPFPTEWRTRALLISYRTDKILAGWLVAPVPVICTTYLYLPPLLWGWRQQFLWNAGTYLLNNMATHPRSLSTSITGLQDSCPNSTFLCACYPSHVLSITSSSPTSCNMCIKCLKCIALLFQLIPKLNTFLFQ